MQNHNYNAHKKKKTHASNSVHSQNRNPIKTYDLFKINQMYAVVGCGFET